MVIVLRCGFYYYSEMVRPKDQETVAIKKIVYCSQFPRRGTCYAMWGGRGTWRKHRGQSGDRRREGKMWASIFIVVSMGRKGESRLSKFKAG